MLAAEAKTVLDSWVRYEGQLKQREQQELAQAVISKVQKELENPKFLQQILTQSVADVESKSSILLWKGYADSVNRNCSVQGTVELLLSDVGIYLDYPY